MHSKFYTSIDVTFNSVSYFISTVASLIPQPMPSSGDLQKEIFPQPLQGYTRRSKNVVSTLLSIDPVFAAVNPDPPHSASLPLILHFLVLRWILLLLQTWTFILHIERVNNLVPSILFLILFFL